MGDGVEEIHVRLGVHDLLRVVQAIVAGEHRRLMDEGKQFVAYLDEKSDEIENPAERRRTQTPTVDYRMPVAVYMED